MDLNQNFIPVKMNNTTSGTKALNSNRRRLSDEEEHLPNRVINLFPLPIVDKTAKNTKEMLAKKQEQIDK